MDTSLDVAALRDLVSSLRGSELALVYTDPRFWLLIAGVFLLERVMPAKLDQPIWSAGLVQDGVYFLATTLVQLFVVAGYAALLKWGYDAYLGVLTIESVAGWPAWAKLTTAILVDDFLGWFHHLLRHKVPLFWCFHVIHHSQRELNPLTDLRYHPVEYLVSKTVSALPMFMLGAAFPLVVGYLFFQQWYTKFYHANLRTNLGILRYVLVTPQSHRVHHSIEARHRDRNLGVIFSVWDYLFGTQWREYDDYPDAGLPDEALPLEKKASGLSPVTTLWAQFVYSFRLARQRPT